MIYSADFWPVIGGVQSVIMTLAQGLAAGDRAREFDCTVVTETPAGMASDSRLPFRVVRNPSLIELSRLVWQSDLVHIAGPALRPLALSFLLRKKVVVEHHGFQALCPNGLLFHEPTRTSCPGHFLAGLHGECWKCNAQDGYGRSLKLWALTFVRRWSCRFVNANIAPTLWLKQLLELPKTLVISHGVAERPVAPFTGSTSPKFAFIGRLVSTKGLELLLHASCELWNKRLEFRLLIIGEGSEDQHLRRLCGQLGVDQKVDFVGHVPEDQVQALLGSAIAIVVPSVAGEVFGLVIVENMMRGRLAIVPEGGPLAEVAGQAGLKFTAGNAKSLAACMENLLQSPEVAVQLGDCARRHSLKNYSAEQMLEGHLSVYQQVLK